MLRIHCDLLTHAFIIITVIASMVLAGHQTVQTVIPTTYSVEVAIAGEPYTLLCPIDNRNHFPSWFGPPAFSYNITDYWYINKNVTKIVSWANDTRSIHLSTITGTNEGLYTCDGWNNIGDRHIINLTVAHISDRRLVADAPSTASRTRDAVNVYYWLLVGMVSHWFR